MATAPWVELLNFDEDSYLADKGDADDMLVTVQVHVGMHIQWIPWMGEFPFDRFVVHISCKVCFVAYLLVTPHPTAA